MSSSESQVPKNKGLEAARKRTKMRNLSTKSVEQLFWATLSRNKLSSASKKRLLELYKERVASNTIRAFTNAMGRDDTQIKPRDINFKGLRVIVKDKRQKPKKKAATA